MDVRGGLEEVLVGVDRLREEPAAEQRAVEPVAPVEPLSVPRPEMVHAGRQVAVRTEQDQVVVVAHQAVGVGLDSLVALEVVEETEESPPVPIVEVDRLVAGTPVHHVVPAAGRVVPEGSCHGANATNGV